MAGVRITQLTPAGLSGQRYGSFAGRAAVATSEPTDVFSAERGGTGVHTLFDLTVTKPVLHTWYLATVDLVTAAEGIFDPDVFDPDVFSVGLAGVAYQGLVAQHSGVGASAAVAGLSGGVGVALTLVNALGTGGYGRRFMDQFVTNVPGYSEPYDLLTATLRCRVYWEDKPSEVLTVGGELYIQPESIIWDSAPGQPETVSLSFGLDLRRYRLLPREIITTDRYAHAPDNAVGQPIPLWFGAQLRVPLTLLDADGGLYLVGTSPEDTPISSVSRLWTIRPDPTSDEQDQPIAMPVKITTAGEEVLDVAGNATNLVLKSAAQRFELDTDGAFIYAVRLRLKRAAAGTPCVGSISLAIVKDADGLPSDTLIDNNASSEVTSAIVTTGVYADYDIPFQANKLSRPAYIPPNRGIWLVVRYAKTSGDLHLEIDNTGAYARGILATQDTATDAQWILSGKQQRRSPVRTDFTGIGYLLQNAATGAIVTMPPVTIP